MNSSHLARGLAAATLVLGLAGCSGHADRQSGSSAVRLSPEPATVTSQLSVVVEASYVDPVQCVYRWRRNNQAVPGAAGPVLDPDKFRKGDVVAVDVAVPAREGQAAQTLSAEVRVADAPPVVRDARVAVDLASGGLELVATADCADPDGDPLNVTYRWFRNGQPLADAGPRLSAASFARGDQVTVEAVASDGEQKSQPRRSDEFVLKNRAPRFSEQPTSLSAAEGSFRFQAKATDPDGDAIKFELVQGPAGMTVTPDGTIDWAVPARDVRQPEYPVTIRATDSNGGQATQDFTIRLTTQDKKS